MVIDMKTGLCGRDRKADHWLRGKECRSGMMLRHQTFWERQAQSASKISGWSHDATVESAAGISMDVKEQVMELLPTTDNMLEANIKNYEKRSRCRTSDNELWIANDEQGKTAARRGSFWELQERCVEHTRSWRELFETSTKCGLC